MLRSMTGFGRGVAEGDAGRAVVELRSVNHRFLDVAVRLPRELMAIEPALVGEAKGRLARGRVEVHVHTVGRVGAGEVATNESLYQGVVDAMARLTGLPVSDPELRRLALTQPGVLEIAAGAEGQAPEPWEPVVLKAAGQALEALVEMRAREGASLRDAMHRVVSEIEANVGRVESATLNLTAQLQSRLADRMRVLVGQEVDDARLLQEAALLADKSDVSEEVDRLRSHLAQLRAALDGEGPVGRRLEFLVQESNREVNTLGSKLGDAQARARVVDMKAGLEKLREQAANVE